MLEARTEDEAFAQSRACDGASVAAGRPGVVAAGRKLPVLIILHQHHSTPGHIGQWLVRHGHGLDIRRPRFGDPLPETMRQHAGAIIFGGPMSANDPDDYIQAETAFIGVTLEERKPFLGICLGAQMLANHLGGTVSYHPGRHVEIGYHKVEVTPAARVICAWPERFYQWHREGFDVPRSATVLATADGPFLNQAFVYGGSAYGLQFHPEITYAQVHRWTGNNTQRLQLPGAQPREEHFRGHFLHAPRVHRWMDDFMARWLRRETGPRHNAAGKMAATR